MFHDQHSAVIMMADEFLLYAFYKRQVLSDTTGEAQRLTALMLAHIEPPAR